MAYWITFLNRDADCDVARSQFADSALWRVSLEAVRKIGHQALMAVSNGKLWVDPGVDGYHDLLPHTRGDENHPSETNPWGARPAYLADINESEALTAPGALRSPDRDRIGRFVAEALDRCCEYSPTYLSVPQLPFTGDATRHKGNRALAEAAGRWWRRHGQGIKAILPVILTHHDQYRNRTERSKRLKVVGDCLRFSKANRAWVVDSSFCDQVGYSTHTKRLGDLVAFHEELLAEHRCRIVAGPYWATNLLLYARGIATHAGIGAGSAYQYHIPSGYAPRAAAARIALPPLRRTVRAEPALKRWLKSVCQELPTGDPGRKQLEVVLRDFDRYGARKVARQQVAKSYRTWLEVLNLEGVSREERALALYQDLSRAYVFAKRLKLPLPKTDGPGDPALLMQQFMLNCL